MSMRRALTLVELMLAISLSLVLVYAAFTAFRVASAAITTCQRLSLENSLFRLGFIAGLEENDFWTAYDDPDDATKQPSRTRNGGTGDYVDINTPSLGSNGRPFVPLTLSRSALSWDVSDPNAWWRGGIDYRDTYGRFRELARIGHPDKATMSYRAWLPELADTLLNQVGAYGVSEYLPPHLPYGYYVSPSGTNSSGVAVGTEGGADFSRKAFKAFHAHWSTGTDSSTMGASAYYPRGRFGSNGMVVIPRADSRQGTTAVGEWIDRGAQRRGHPSSGDAWAWKTNLPNLRTKNALTELVPSAWPRLQVNVSHYMYFNQATNLIQINLVSPLTTEARQLSLVCTGTTLRGARMQRGLDTGVP